MTAKADNAAYNTWSIADAAKAIAAGDLTSEALVTSCLARIREREDDVGAWIHLDAERALAEARERDAITSQSPLHGIPFGIKDIIDTADMPTGYGSPIYPDAHPFWDATCVALLREAGCVALGKTVTTEFATRHAGKTCNPLDLTRTPGGSSSGSAAAVADFMVPVAYGTQTTGSVIRPGAYCGIVATKPTFGMINRSGVKELCESLDTIGFYTRTVEDAALFLHVLADYPMTDFGGVEDLKPKIAICRTTVWDEAKPETVALFGSLAERLGRAGAEVRELVLPADFDDIAPAQAVLNDYESLRAMAYERINFPDLLSEELSAPRRSSAPSATRATSTPGRSTMRDTARPCCRACSRKTKSSWHRPPRGSPRSGIRTREAPFSVRSGMRFTCRASAFPPERDMRFGRNAVGRADYRPLPRRRSCLRPCGVGEAGIVGLSRTPQRIAIGKSVSRTPQRT